MPAELFQTSETAFRLAVCVEAGSLDGRPVVRVRWESEEEAEAPEWIPCLAGVRIRVGDEVLLAPVKEGPSWVAIGVLAAASEAASTVRTKLPASGYELTSDAGQQGDRVQLRNPAGALSLEVRIAEDRLWLRFPTRDAVLACDGNLEVRAGECLRLSAHDYELNLTGDATSKVAGKSKADAAEHEMHSSTGPMRLRAEKNMVINGRFILLNTKEEEKWS